jgi:hypothetical protein
VANSSGSQAYVACCFDACGPTFPAQLYYDVECRGFPDTGDWDIDWKSLVPVVVWFTVFLAVIVFVRDHLRKGDEREYFKNYRKYVGSEYFEDFRDLVRKGFV